MVRQGGLGDGPGNGMVGAGRQTGRQRTDGRFIRLSRATFAILVQNITLALGVKALFFALTFTGHATMWMAVFADVGTALLVVANGLRAMRQ